MPEFDLSLAVFILAVALGSYVQSVAGFAMGMIIIAIVGATGVVPLMTTAAVVSFISLMNIGLSLHGHYGSVDRRAFVWMALGQIPSIGLGLWLLAVLSSSARDTLQILLGLFILFGSAAMALRPVPQEARSGRLTFLAAGLAGGVLGGLFAASGPVIGWFTYRQPLPVRVIRASLLSCFAVSTFSRSLMVVGSGAITIEILWLTAFSVPLVLLVSWLANRYPPAIPEVLMRRLAFSLLTLLGGWIVVSAVWF